MSYCRFRNTLQYLQDCFEHINDQEFEVEDVADMGENQHAEFKAREKLIALCLEIAEEFADFFDEQQKEKVQNWYFTLALDDKNTKKMCLCILDTFSNARKTIKDLYNSYWITQLNENEFNEYNHTYYILYFDKETVMKWYFTFMQKQVDLANKFVCFEGTFYEAREKMVKQYGDQWAFQYSEKDFAGQPEMYGLKEIK